MRREYLRRRSAFLPRRVRPLAAVLVGVALLLVAFRLAAPGLFVTAISPFWRAGTFMTNAAGGFFAVFHERATLEHERDALSAQVEALSAQNAALAAKDADLTALLGDRTDAADGILVGVLARPPEAAYDTLVVDQGVDSGVAVGALAYGPGGVPLGTVASVTRRSARIALYSAPARETDAWLGAARTPLTLTGLGSGAFYAEAPNTASTTIGDPVYVSGPGALPIGVVARVDSDPSSPKSVIRVKPALNLFSITWVTIAHTP